MTSRALLRKDCSYKWDRDYCLSRTNHCCVIADEHAALTGSCSYKVALKRGSARTALLMQRANQAMLYRHCKELSLEMDAERYFRMALRWLKVFIAKALNPAADRCNCVD